MRLIVGLGNPGDEYETTWHNMGFLLVDRLAELWGARRFRLQAEARIAEAIFSGHRVILVKPQTLMNLSGNSVRPLLEAYCDRDSSRLTVVCDDVALPVGMIRVRTMGSAGGQKGLKSIIERLGTGEFPRVRMGIKPDHPIQDLADFVLSPVPKRLRAQVEEMVDRSAEAVSTIISKGADTAMQMFNQKVKPESSETGGKKPEGAE